MTMSLVFLILALTATSFDAIEAAEDRRLLCYYSNWSAYRTDLGLFKIEDIDTDLCTHLVYSFAILNPNTLTIDIGDPYIDIENNGYKNFVELKKKNPNLKTMISIGGWADSNSEEYPDKYSRMVSNRNNIATFVGSVIPFLKTYGFDGLDIDWEYPKTEADKTGFVDLLIGLKGIFDQENLLLSAAIPFNKTILDAGYDIKQLDSLLHFVNFMTYDMHGSWEPDVADHHAPLGSRPGDDDVNIESAVDYLLARDMKPERINLGIPLYGRSWTLDKDHQISADDDISPPTPAKGPGDAGYWTLIDGFLSYYEICYSIKSKNWIPIDDPSGKIGPYAYSRRSPPIQWVGYDDVNMIRVKSQYLLDKKLGGAAVWEVSLDDFTGYCGDGYNPLLTALSEMIL